MEDWTPSSWTTKPIKQDVVYDDKEGVQAALNKLQKLPPLVTTQEILNLKKSLRNVALGKAFVLQGGISSCLNT
jgi:3-deoxy-7-phosphoheptulonate synthase